MSDRWDFRVLGCGNITSVAGEIVRGVAAA